VLVSVNITLAGTIATFNATSFQYRMSSFLGVPHHMISMDVQAASVRVAVSVTAEGLPEGRRIETRLLAYNTTALSSALGGNLLVEAVSLPRVFLDQVNELSEEEPVDNGLPATTVDSGISRQSGDESATGTVAAISASAFLAVCFGTACYFRSRIDKTRLKQLTKIQITISKSISIATPKLGRKLSPVAKPLSAKPANLAEARPTDHVKVRLEVCSQARAGYEDGAHVQVTLALGPRPVQLSASLVRLLQPPSGDIPEENARPYSDDEDTVVAPPLPWDMTLDEIRTRAAEAVQASRERAKTAVEQEAVGSPTVQMSDESNVSEDADLDAVTRAILFTSVTGAPAATATVAHCIDRSDQEAMSRVKQRVEAARRRARARVVSVDESMVAPGIASESPTAVAPESPAAVAPESPAAVAPESPAAMAPGPSPSVSYLEPQPLIVSTTSILNVPALLKQQSSEAQRPASTPGKLKWTQGPSGQWVRVIPQASAPSPDAKSQTVPVDPVPPVAASPDDAKHPIVESPQPSAQEMVASSSETARQAKARERVDRARAKMRTSRTSANEARAAQMRWLERTTAYGINYNSELPSPVAHSSASPAEAAPVPPQPAPGRSPVTRAQGWLARQLQLQRSFSFDEEESPTAPTDVSQSTHQPLAPRHAPRVPPACTRIRHVTSISGGHRDAPATFASRAPPSHKYDETVSTPEKKERR